MDSELKPTLKSESARKRRRTGVTTALALATWRRTAGALIEAGTAGGVVRIDTRLGPAQGHHSDTSTPHENTSPEFSNIPGIMRCAAFQEATPNRKQ